ncbi:response regulator [Tahibacter amnicola]|uniref:Response regulator n=1 Tax=Tahibacter amnicola TaxID=2976241 RepID=A0ABY6BK41_9GAMM|nr:response regulator [Tahibacter amnicola]UXI70383.1 response regulator [Tahibacter amnicola]
MSKPKVIFIDDEERMVRSLERMFRGRYDVIATTNPQQVLDLVRTERIHVVVSDHRMPEMTGVDLLTEVRTISPSTLRILLTGYADLAAVIGSINDGEIFRFLRKPWDEGELRKKVDDAASISQALFEHGASTAAAEPSPSATDILVIDDSEDVCQLVRRALGDTQRVHWSNNLEDAIDIMGQSHIGVVLSDLHVNGSDISGALKLLKRHDPTLITVVLTAFHHSGQLIDLINQAQVFRVLGKPVDSDSLAPIVSEAVSRSQKLSVDPTLVRQYAVESTVEADNGPISEKLRALFTPGQQP